MSKAPIPGKTKTRLQTHLTHEQCAQLHKVCLKDLCANLKDSCYTLYLFFTGGSQEDFPVELREKFKLLPQTGNDLGARMQCAFKYCLQRHNRVVMIGSDCPNITSPMIDRAVSALNSNDVVLGPSNDGGYYLLGLKAMIDSLFKDISWGKASVFNETIGIITTSGLNCFLLDEKIDLDTIEDCKLLLENMNNINMHSLENTNVFLKRILEF